MASSEIPAYQHILYAPYYFVCIRLKMALDRVPICIEIIYIFRFRWVCSGKPKLKYKQLCSQRKNCYPNICEISARLPRDTVITPI